MTKHLIEMADVSIIRDGKTIVDNINLRIQVGEHVAILGPNGCGKSTLIRAMTHEIYPHGGRGTVNVLGRDRWEVRNLRTILGVVSNEPREPLLGSPTVLELAVSGLLGTYGVTWGYEVTPTMWDRAFRALTLVDASHLADRTVETLSAGEHRRAFIARALVSEPVGLILDEPTTNLDLVARSGFMNTVRNIANGGHTVILVTHHFEEIFPEIDRVVLMARGQVLADGTPSDVLTNDLVSAAFGAPIQMEGPPFRATLRA